MAISILIVDDDKLLVQKLYETVNWESLGIRMVFTAYNIRQAQKYLEDYPIQLLLCDIDMPQGSGLELLEWIRSEKMDVECAFLSSYANFAYAQKALKLSSREYLLKPISNSDLEYALSKLVDVVKAKEKPETQTTDKRKENFWKEILVNRLQEQQRIEEAIDSGLYQKHDQICLDIIKIWEIPSSETYKRDIALYDFVLNNISTEYFRDSNSSLEAVVRLADLEWMLIFCKKDELSITKEIYTEFKKHLTRGFFPQCFVYAGKAGDFSTIIRQRDRLEEIERNAVPGEGDILLEEKWSAKQYNYVIPVWDIWERDMAHSGQLLQIEESVLKYISSMGKEYIRTAHLKRFIHELIQMLYRYLNDQGITFEQIFDGNEFDTYLKSAGLSATGLQVFVRYLFDKLNGNRQSDNRQESVIVQLKEYIDQHLSENLSRTVLAQNVYLSEDYISKIFVKMTGMSIPNYIAGRRIEKAREYIQNSSMPISKIALEVGYSNFSYFSKTFRDLVGCTPNEYRNRYLK